MSTSKSSDPDPVLGSIPTHERKAWTKEDYYDNDNYIIKADEEDVTSAKKERSEENDPKEKDDAWKSREAESNRYFLPGELTTQIEQLKWNNQFQNILEEIRRNPFAKNTRNITLLAQLHRLYANFLLTAKLYAKIIVEEYYLPASSKTVKPTNVGGVAGGDKYIAEGIFFKFALDSKHLYNGDSNAAKSAGHELSSINTLLGLNLDNLCLPLVVVIDYLGFRVSCISLLPVSSATLLYGSSDAGRTVHSKDEQLATSITEAAEQLGLKPHIAGNGTVVSTAIDLEGHKGDDGRYYLLDTARLMPPEVPTGPGTFLYKLLRPEFVRKYHKDQNKRLCSDAFSKFIGQDPNKNEHNQEVSEACQYLKENIVKEFAKWLIAEGGPTPSNQKKAQELSLTKEMHKRGINMRLLGFLFTCFMDNVTESGDYWKTRIVNEMAVRIAKGTLRVLMRKAMQKIQIRITEPYVVLVVNYLNLLLGSSIASQRYWRNEMTASILKSFFYYRNRVSANEERENDFLSNSLRMLDKTRFLNEFAERCGIQLPPNFEQRRFKLERPFVEGDIQKIVPKEKKLSIIDFAEVFMMIDDVLVFDFLSAPSLIYLEALCSQVERIFQLLRYYSKMVSLQVSFLFVFAKAAFYIENYVHVVCQNITGQLSYDIRTKKRMLNKLQKAIVDENGTDIHLLTIEKIVAIAENPSLMKEALQKNPDFFRILADWSSLWNKLGRQYLVLSCAAIAVLSWINKQNQDEEKYKASIKWLQKEHETLCKSKTKGIANLAKYYESKLRLLKEDATEMLKTVAKLQ